MRGSARITALLWLALLAGAGLVIHHSLRISGDLRLFMPAPHDAVGRLLMRPSCCCCRFRGHPPKRSPSPRRS